MTCHIFLVTTISFATLCPFQAVLAEDYFNKSFEWHYQGARWTWSLSIPQSLYNTYRRVPVSERVKDGVAGYSFLVTTQDYYVRQVASKLHEAATQEGYGAFDEVSFILAFVQSLPYTSDSVTTKFDEYPRFPIESLVDDGGDCEDTAVLFATLVTILNYDAIFISPPSHLAVGVWGNNLYGSYYTYGSKKYYYCETTGNNWKIGDIPATYQGSSAYLYSINENRQYIPSQDTSRVPPTPDQESETTPFFQLHPEMLGIILAGILALVIVIAIFIFTKLTKASKIREFILNPQVEINEETRKTVEQTKVGKFFCRYCGAENKTDANFCEKCGKKIG